MAHAKLRTIIVGCGGITTHTASALRGKPWFEPVALVDVSADALVKAGELYGVPCAAHYDDLALALDGSAADAVMINTPSELHFAQCRAALERGLHVLVAKPVTDDYERAVALVELAQARGVTLSVAQQIRYNRHYTALRQFVASGTLGKVEAAWFMNSKPRPNPANLAGMAQPSLYENACHHFDAFLAVFGAVRPEWIMCDGFVPSWSPYAGPCMVNALIRFSGGLHVSYHGGFSSRAPMYEFRLEGAEGALCCHGVHMSNDTMRYELAPALGQFAPAEIDADVPACAPWEPFFDVWHDYVAGGAEPPFSGRNNLQVFAMLSAAIESVNTGRAVEIAGNPAYATAFGGAPS